MKTIKVKTVREKPKSLNEIFGFLMTDKDFKEFEKHWNDPKEPIDITGIDFSTEEKYNNSKSSRKAKNKK